VAIARTGASIAVAAVWIAATRYQIGAFNAPPAASAQPESADAMSRQACTAV
jgi:hypothetical protein